jgi:signal peptidase I
MKQQEQDHTKAAGVKAFLKELGIVLGAFLVLNSFVLASFEVPTGSMENEIMTGDFLLVNKFVFGGTTPRTIPFTNTKIPAFKHETEASEFAYYLKRCIALAGDTLQIVNKVVTVNGQPAPVPRNIKFSTPYAKPSSYPEDRIFPEGMRFNEDNYGPVVVPKKGMVIALTPENLAQWQVFIGREGHACTLVNGAVHIDGQPQSSYTVARNYVFGMCDNRDNSLDSRFWGFIPEEDVVGSPLIVYWSWDPDISFFSLPQKLASIRWSRLGTLVK